MRYSGAYQLARAGKSCGRQSWSYRRPLPRGRGDWWELNLAKGTGRGLWRVRESVCGLKAAGTYTRLTLGEP